MQWIKYSRYNNCQDQSLVLGSKIMTNASKYPIELFYCLIHMYDRA